jgi:branched-chain amino acid transport system permease protein
MGIVLILVMQYRPQGILGHRKEPASPIRLTRKTPDAGSSPDTAAEEAGTKGAVTDE